MTKTISGFADGRDPGELKATQKGISWPKATGGKGEGRSTHKQLDELHLAKNQGGDHDEECKQRTRSAVQVDFG